MPYDAPLPVRFLSKLVLDILPAALASVIGGVLFAQYQVGRPAARAPAIEQAAPASAEMMRLVRDEHALIADFLKAELAAEKSRLAEEEGARRVAAAAKPAAATAAGHVAAVPAAPKAAVPRGRRMPAAVAAASPPPLAIIPAPQDEGAEPSPARDPGSLLAKTIDIKNRVVGVTQWVVGAIGGIPSRIASIGGRIVGLPTSSSSAGWRVSALW